MAQTNAVDNSYQKGFIPFAIAALLVSLIGGFTAVLGPAFVAEAGIDYNNTTWISLALAMSSAACAPILGKLCDVFGRRTTMLTGIVIFAVGNVLTAIAPTLPIMLAARFVVGIGTAAIAPVVMSYIVTEYPPDKMAKGFALYMLISSAAVVVGPTCGGLIMNAAGWRAMMWVCVALCVLVFFICLMTLKKAPFEKKSLANFDKPGAVLVLIFFSLFLCVPTLAQNMGVGSMPFIIVAAAALIALIILFTLEKKASFPLINGKFVGRKEFIIPVLILFLTQGLMMANMTNVIVFVRYTQPDNVLISSFAISIMYLGMCLGSIIVGPQADKIEPKLVSTVSLLVTGIGVGLMYLFRADSGFPLFAAALGILGFGLGGNATIFMKVALSGLPADIAGASTGTYGLFRDISAPFGVAVFVPMFANGVTRNTAAFAAQGTGEGQALLDAAVASMHSLVMIEIVCVVAAIVLVQFLPKIYGGKKA